MNNEILKNFNGDELASTVFENKYAMRNEKDELLEFSMNDVWKRMLNEVKKVDETDFSILENNFLPGGRILYALGNDHDKTATLSNCYVTEIKEDSIEGIFDTSKRQARLFSKGGGVGIDISKLRPKNAKVNNSAKTTSGSVSFMDLFSQVTGLIGQHGRRGALILTMDISHPDIVDFIKVKGGKDKTKVQFANISVKVTNDFMEAIENDDDWLMSYQLEDKNRVIEKTEKARVIWDLIVESNYNGAEPGLLYWDTVLKNDPSSNFKETKPISCNPCSELPMANGENCLLGSVNLSNFVNNIFTDKANFDYDKFKEVITLSTRFLDNMNVINYDRQPLEENKIALKLGNRVGLGITGLADMLIKMNLKYDSDEAINFVSEVMSKFKEFNLNSSIDLAIERGQCEILNKYNNKIELDKFKSHHWFGSLDINYKEKFNENGIRNISTSTVAPNGSLAIILQGTSGIEPIFALSYERIVKGKKNNEKDDVHVVYHPLVKEYNLIFGENAHLKNKNFVTSSSIDWKQRIKMQSVIQENIQSSISSTINLPNDISKEVISNIYKEAWKQNLKGITIYRDGSRDGILKEIDTKRKDIGVLENVKFPEEQQAIMKVIKSEGRKWYCTYTLDEETKLPNSLFVNTNSTETNIITDNVLEHLEKLAEKHIKDKYLDDLKQKHSNQNNVTKIARTISLLLRHNIPMLEIIKTIEKIQPPIYSFVFQIKKLLSKFVEGEYTGEKCSECGNQLVFEGGCSICMNCGNTACS